MGRLGEVRGAKVLGYKSKATYVWHACLDCGKERWVQRLKGLPTSLRCNSCANRLKNLKDGQIVNAKGYVMVRLSPSDFFAPMRNSTGYVLEHRLVMAQHLGRCLQPWEMVHHKDGIRDHNEYGNLKMTTAGSHTIEHSKGYRDGYQKGLVNGRAKQIEELKQEIRLLRWQIKENVIKDGERNWDNIGEA